MKKLLLTFVYSYTIILVYAQTPSIQWQKCYGGTQGESAKSIEQTNDGGFVIAGTSASNDGDVTGHHGFTGVTDYWIVKVDNIGTIQWQKSLGGSNDDYANSIQQTIDGGYIIAGSSESNDGNVNGNHGDSDYWIVKLDHTGAIQWQKSLGGSDRDVANCIRQTSDSGYIVAGESWSNDGDVSGNHSTVDYWIVKLDNTGTIQWQKSLGGTGDDRANSIQQTTDGGYIVAGNSYSYNDGDVTGNHATSNNGPSDYWILKLDNTGAIQWQKCLGGSEYEYAYSINENSDGGYIIAGSSTSNDGDVSGHHGATGDDSDFKDYWIVKINNTGNIEWQKSFGGTSSDEANAVQQTVDGGYIVVGSSSSNDGDVSGHYNGYDYWVLKLDGNGIIEWQKSMGGTSDDNAESIQQTTDGGYIAAGLSWSNDGDVTGNEVVNYWVVKLGGTVSIEYLNKESNISISPNPATTQLTIRTDNIAQTDYTIYDVTGRILNTGSFNQNATISISDFAKGNYIIQLTNNQNTITRKFIKQ